MQGLILTWLAMAKTKDLPGRLQRRLTFLDTINSQRELLSLVRRKKDRNVSLNDKEEERFPVLLAYSILSHASTPVTFVNADGRTTKWNIYELGLDLKSLRGNRVILTDGQSKVRYEIRISQLWNFFERELKHIFPFALEEAIHMSREAPIREQPTSFSFSSESKV